MTILDDQDIDTLIQEHQALLRAHGDAQRRCSEQLRAQAEEIARLQAQAMRLRAQVVLRDTALAWARDDRDALEAAMPGLPRRAAMARRMDALLARVQELMRERLHWQRGVLDQAGPPPGISTEPPRPVALADDPPGLEASLVAADLVICQTGCLSHGDYWRVQDHCKRTGKACVLVEEPDSLRIVRIHRAEASGALIDHQG